MENLIHKELSYKIIGILYSIYNVMGPGLQEKYYQRAISKVLAKEGIHYSEQVKVDINVNGINIGRYFLDFIVENKIVLEIKSKSFFSIRDIKQVLGYLKKTNIELGILAAFTTEGIKYKRILRGYSRNPQEIREIREN